MARKKHAEEHENLERWLISYADFITLLFATFVVLYALSQTDIKKFAEMSVSMRKAFASQSVLQGDQGILDGSGLNIMSGTDNESNMIPPLFEYMEAKFEENAFKQTKESVEKIAESNETSGIDSYVSERGLVVSLAESLFFASGSAEIKHSAYPTLSKIGLVLEKKFADHPIRVEGHTDSIPIKSSIYPSNWELSSARASSVVRFMLSNSKFDKNRFAAVGYADGRPIADNKTAIGRDKNRRVEIVVLRNKLAKSESKISGINKDRIDNIKDLEQKQNKELQQYQNVSDAAKKLLRQSGESVQDVVLSHDSYEKQSERLAKELKLKEEKRKKEIKLPNLDLKKPVKLTTEQQTQIESARKKGLINDAVAELMKQRGSTKDVVVIQQNSR